jgi:hypothetical protein
MEAQAVNVVAAAAAAAEAVTAVDAKAATGENAEDITQPTKVTNTRSSAVSSIQDTRMTKMENRLEHMMTAMSFLTEKMDSVIDTVMDDRTKREHDDLSTAASSFEKKDRKKANHNFTPTKPTRPSFEEAEQHQSP